MVCITVVVLNRHVSHLDLISMLTAGYTHMQVPLQASSALSLRVPRVDPTLLLISIAIIPASSVLIPWSHANPAELMLALSTRHMVTSTVLLDRALAFRTLFCVC